MTLKGCNNSTNSLLSSSALVEKCFIFTSVRWAKTGRGFNPDIQPFFTIKADKSESFHQIFKKWTFLENRH